MPPLLIPVTDPADETAPLGTGSSDWALTLPAMNEIVAEQWPALVRLAALLLGDRAPAEDVVQDACEATWRRRPAVTSRDHLIGYLRTAVVNGCRSAGRRRATAARHLHLFRPSTEHDHEPAADVPMLAAERRTEVIAALARLGDRQREVLVLRYWAELTESEIAEAMSISRGTVKSTAHHALHRLAFLLGDTR